MKTKKKLTYFAKFIGVPRELVRQNYFFAVPHIKQGPPWDFCSCFNVYYYF